ncbi:unnamed protein product [Brassica oleracea]
MANVANDGIMAEVNRMLEEMFLLETGVSILFLLLSISLDLMVSCPWVQQRLAAGDRLSVRVFLRRINGTLTPAEENEMVRVPIYFLSKAMEDVWFRGSLQSHSLWSTTTLASDVSKVT